MGSTQQDTERHHHPATNGDPTQVIKSFFIIMMIIVIFTHTQPTHLALQIQCLWTSTPAARHLRRSCRKLLEMGAEWVRFLEGRTTSLGKKKKSYPRPDFVGRTYLSSIPECLPSANLSKADKTPYYKSKLLKLG